MSDRLNIIDFVGKEKGQAAPGELGAGEQQAAGAISLRLDKTLEEMVQELEKVASCQQSAGLGAANDSIPPFYAFCVGLESIGDSLIPHFGQSFEALCLEHTVLPSRLLDLYQVRVIAFIRYLIQLAQVHGFAFDGGPRAAGKAEQLALSGLEAHLRNRAACESDRLIAIVACSA